MRWSERQIAMLDEMGVRLWPDPHTGRTDGTPPPPAERGESNASALPESGVGKPVAMVVRDRAVGVEAMDWDALRQAVVDCTACTLCHGRRQTVFGVGHLHAHWMVVGEAPGEQEDIQGEPFVGKSGQLLDNMLRALGLSRREAPPPGGEGSVSDPARQVYIANTLKCRPPGNRNPEPDEIAECEPFLIRQIESVKPKVIVALGTFAAKTLLRSDLPISRLRGQFYDYHGAKLLPTFHPAFLLRSPERKRDVWDDMKKVRAVLAGEA